MVSPVLQDTFLAKTKNIRGCFVDNLYYSARICYSPVEPKNVFCDFLGFTGIKEQTKILAKIILAFIKGHFEILICREHKHPSEYFEVVCGYISRSFSTAQTGSVFPEKAEVPSDRLHSSKKGLQTTSSRNKWCKIVDVECTLFGKAWMSWSAFRRIASDGRKWHKWFMRYGPFRRHWQPYS